MPQPKILDAGLQFTSVPQKRTKTDLIVLHHADSSKCTVQDVHRWHLANGWLGIGYHYFVAKSGDVFAGRPEDTVGAHCEGQNDHSIGLCAEGDYSKEQMPAEQQQAVSNLMTWLKEKYPGAAVKRHCDLCATECPGRNYPFETIVTAVTTPTWDPVAEIGLMARDSLASTEHKPDDPLTWGEFATVINRLRGNRIA